MSPSLEYGKPPRWIVFCLASVIVVAIAVIYANSLGGPFIFDDNHAIADNERIRRLWPPGPLLESLPGNTLLNRPLVTVSLAINYAIDGLNVRGYHLFNVGVHLLASLVLFGVIRRTLTGRLLRNRFGPTATWVAAAATLIWAVHPLATDAVTYIIQRCELLMGLFYLLTLYCAIRSFDSPHPTPWYAAAVACCALGMCCKEVMVSAPLAVLLYDRTFVSRSWGRSIRRHAALYIGLAASWLVLGFLMISGPRNYTVGFDLPITAFDYLKTQAGVILHYLRLAFWPVGLVVCYDDWPVARTCREFVPQGLVILALLAGTCWGLQRRSAFGFLGTCFFLILAPTSSFMPIVTEFAAERRMYLPLAAVVVLVICSVYVLLERLFALFASPNMTPSVPRRDMLSVFIGLTVLLALVLGRLTILRNRDYRTVLSIWTAVAQQRPFNASAYNEIGRVLSEEGRFDEAIPRIMRALELKPHFAEAHYNYGLALEKKGRWQDSIEHFEEALQYRPSYATSHINLGLALAETGRIDEAIEHYQEAIRLKPDSQEAYNDLGLARMRKGQTDAAIAEYMQALQIKPDYANAHFNLGLALAKQKRLSEAVEHWRQALLQNPNSSEVHSSLALAADLQGKTDEAAKLYLDALRLDANNFAARRDYGTLLARQKMSAEAAAQFEAALRIRPASADVENNLGSVLADMGRLDEAVDHFHKALVIDPALAAAHEGLGEVLERKDKIEEALLEYQTALRLDPRDPEALARLDRLSTRPASQRF